MRWIYLAIIILFAAATIIFALQNFEIVTVSLLGFNARVPLALLVAVSYLLGAATGGSLFALLRRSYEGSRRRMMNRDSEQAGQSPVRKSQSLVLSGGLPIVPCCRQIGQHLMRRSKGLDLSLRSVYVWPERLCSVGVQ